MPMRRGALLLILLAGCVSPEPSRPAVAWQSLKAEADPGPDRVLFDVALVQRPLGDEFLTDEIWSYTDEMIVPPEQRELLELNGYRVGLLVGSPPEKLLHLLRSERSCVDRRGRSVPSGSMLRQDLADRDVPVEGFLLVGKSLETLKLDRPRFGFDLLPTLKPNDVVRLQMTPRIETGDKAVNYKPLPDESKWALEMKRPTRVLKDLAFAIDMSPNQVLIVGPRLERDGSVGYHSLTGTHDGIDCQRLLIMRQMRSKNAGSGDVAESATSPIAMQASGMSR